MCRCRGGEGRRVARRGWEGATRVFRRVKWSWKAWGEWQNHPTAVRGHGLAGLRASGSGGVFAFPFAEEVLGGFVVEGFEEVGGEGEAAELGGGFVVVFRRVGHFQIAVGDG